MRRTELTLYQKWCLKKANIKKERLIKLYNESDRVLDVGSGNGALALLLNKSSIATTTMDIKNKSTFEEINLIVYDGSNFPFKNNEFDVVQLITVLHHIPWEDQLKVIQEAKRVGKRVIIMEDIFENTFQKYVTFLADSINNNEYYGHPHSNRNDAQWQSLFKKIGLSIDETIYYPAFLLLFKQVTYILSSDCNN